MWPNEFVVIFLDGGSLTAEFGRIAAPRSGRFANAVGVSDSRKPHAHALARKSPMGWKRVCRGLRPSAPDQLLDIETTRGTRGGRFLKNPHHV